MHTKQELIDSLLVVKQEALDGNIFWISHGICSNWGDKLEFSCLAYDIVGDLADGWEHHSGLKHQPIAGYGWQNNWEGEQLELRLSLIDHILKRLEEAGQEWLDKLYSDYCGDDGIN